MLNAATTLPLLVFLAGLFACGGASTRATPDAGPITLPDASTDRRAAHDAGAPSHDAATDAVADVDNGSPSDAFPAPHPPLPQLTNLRGGPILTTPTVYLVAFPGYPYLTDLQTFASHMASATYWNSVTAEYGVGALTYGGTITLTGQTAANMLTQAQIGTWVAQELASGAFGTPDPEGIYTILYPSTTMITQPNPVVAALPAVQSCTAFYGYHDNISVALTDGGAPTNFAYAVIPTCDTVVDDLTAAISHEWVEAATDPFLTSTGSFGLTGGPDSAYFTVDADHAIWAVLGGGEAGDLCEPEGQSVFITPADVGYTVQRIWSNNLARGSHDPCGPEPSGPSFNAAPVLTETETITSTLLSGTIVTKGVTIPSGASKTIEVDLYSDADTGGPFTVAASDALATSYGLPTSMDFQWDRTQGVNGEKLHLTITVTRASILAGVHAFAITSTLGDRQAVWPGLVFE